MSDDTFSDILVKTSVAHPPITFVEIVIVIIKREKKTLKLSELRSSLFFTVNVDLVKGNREYLRAKN